MLNLGHFEVLATESMEGRRKFIEAVHSKLRRGTFNSAASPSFTYNSSLKKKTLHIVLTVHYIRFFEG